MKRGHGLPLEDTIADPDQQGGREVHGLAAIARVIGGQRDRVAGRDRLDRVPGVVAPSARRAGGRYEQVGGAGNASERGDHREVSEKNRIGFADREQRLGDAAASAIAAASRAA
jgi:hypothetical protein